MSSTYLIPQGPWTVKQLITEYLQWDLPRRIQAYREAWSLDDQTLPAPENYRSYEPPAIDYWPMVVTVQMSTTSIQRIDYTQGLNPVFRCTYAMRTYVWTREISPAQVTETRDRLTTVIRSALLDRPCLEKGTSHYNHRILLDEGSLREEYSDLTQIKGDRFLAGAYLSYNVQLDEVISRASIAELSEIDLALDVKNANPESGVSDVTTTIITG